MVTIGAELSQWNPWCGTGCVDAARVSRNCDQCSHRSAERLMEQIQEGSLDLAILYLLGPAGVVAELLVRGALVLIEPALNERPLTGRSGTRRLGGRVRRQLSRASQLGPGVVSISLRPARARLRYSRTVALVIFEWQPFDLTSSGSVELVPDSPNSHTLLMCLLQ